MESKPSTRTVLKLITPEYQRKLGNRLEGIFRNAWRWDSGVSTKIVVGSIQKITKDAQPRIDEGITARSFFDTERMTSEVDKAREMGISYQETVAGSKGAWCEDVAIVPADEAVVREALTFGFYKSELETTSALLEIYADHKVETDYSFADRNSEKNIKKFRNLVASYRTNDGAPHKDWDQVINFGDEKTKAKFEKRQGQKKFDVQVVEHNEDIDRKLDQMIDNKNVAKAILFKNKDGRVDRVEFWFGHSFCDEPEGTQIVNNVFSARLVEDNPNSEILIKEDRNRDITGTKINRKREIIKKNGEPVYLFDIDTSYRQGEVEKDFNGKALKVVDMNQSTYYSIGWLLDHPDQKSAYTCVSATESSALQFSLLTRPEQLNFLKDLIDKENFIVNPQNIYEYIRSDRFPRTSISRVQSELRSTGGYQKDEIGFAQEGESLINMLGVYTPEDSQKLLTTLFKFHGEIIAGGAFQVSKVAHKDKSDPVQNQVFTTAGNLTTEVVEGVLSGISSTAIDLRMNTDEEDFNEAKRRMGLMGYTTAYVEDFEPILGLIVKEKVIKYRKSMATMSYLLQANQILKDQAISTDQLKFVKIKELNLKFLKVIREIDGIQESQSKR